MLMAIGLTISSLLDKIPVAIEWVRSMLMKLTGLINLPNNSSFLIFAAIISLVLAYLWVKQFVVSGWAKFSTILNLVLLALVFYLVIVYV
jgi:hypothetical protein